VFLNGVLIFFFLICPLFISKETRQCIKGSVTLYFTLWPSRSSYFIYFWIEASTWPHLRHEASICPPLSKF